MKFDALLACIQHYKKPLLALSGGFDSSFLSYALSKSSVTAETITIISDLFPDSEINRAKEISNKFGIKHSLLDLSELHLKTIKNNQFDRCYTCKKAIFTEIKEFALKNGFDAVFDGTTYDDQFKYRPGIKAKDELGVISPIAITKISKDELREMCRQFKLDFAELPSFSCFATRFPYNDILTIEKINAVAKAEEFLKKKGFHLVRVRYHHEIARIELDKKDIKKLLTPDLSEEIVDKLKELGFEYVTLDLDGFESGSMDKKISEEI